jgi:hypothetical protein
LLDPPHQHPKSQHACPFIELLCKLLPTCAWHPIALQPNGAEAQQPCCTTVTVAPKCKIPHSKEQAKAQHDTCHSKQNDIAGHIPCCCQQSHLDNPSTQAVPNWCSQGCNQSNECSVTIRSACSCCLQTPMLPAMHMAATHHTHASHHPQSTTVHQSDKPQTLKKGTTHIQWCPDLCKLLATACMCPMTTPPCAHVQAAASAGS